MDKYNRIKIMVILAMLFLTVAVTAETASGLLEEGIYAEQTQGDIDKAISIYTQITEQHRDEQRIAARATYQLGMCYLKKGDNTEAADYFRRVVTDYPNQQDLVAQAKEQYSKIYPGRQIVERSVTTRQTIDPATLMPADTLAYVEFGSPGKQLETILNMLKGTPIENPLTLIGGRNTPAGRLGAFLNPSMLAEFKKIRGSAAGVTGISNNTSFVAVVDPGDSDALRGLIMAALGNVGKAAEPVEGMNVITIGDQNHQAYVAYDEQVIIAAHPYEQFIWSVKQYKGVTDEPTLASQNKSFSRIGRKIRQDNVITYWANVDAVFTEVKKQFGNAPLPQELAIASYFADFENIDELFAYLSIEPTGLSLEANINFKEGHRCFPYDLMRTPNINKSALLSVPDRSAAVFSFALNESSGPAVEQVQKAVQHLTGLDIGREIFANIEQVTAFVVSPQSQQNAAEATIPVLPGIGVAITSHNPQQTRLILGRILRSIEVGTTNWQNMQSAGLDEGSNKYLLTFGNNKKVYCQMAQLDKTTLLAFSPDVLELSLEALKGQSSVLSTGALGREIAQLPDDTSKVLMVNVGQAIRLVSAYTPVADTNEALQSIAQLAEVFDQTSVQVRTRESVNNFNLHAGIQGIPPVDEVYGPVMQLTKLSQQAKAKAVAEKAKAEKGATIIKTPRSPVIDGTAEDLWSDARQYKLTNVLFSPLSSPNDLAADFKAMWDEDNLYVLIDVTDDRLVNDSSPDEWWFDDSAEVYIDADNSKSNQYDDDDAQYHFDWDKTNPTMDVHQQHGRMENVEFAMVTTEKGYRTEIKFPWKTLGVKPGPGSSIGLDIQVNDDDDGGQRDTKLAWHDSHDVAWDNPQAFGNAELAGLIAWWKFDDSKGNVAKDSSSGKHDGTLVGDAKWTKGRIGGAIELDGDGDFVRIPDEHAFDVSGEITIACWANLRSVPYDYTAIVTKGDNSWRLSTFERQRKFHASVTDWNQLVVDGSTEVPANQWHHVIAAYDGKKLCIYVDGKLDVCKNWTGGIGQNDYDVLIGENAQEQGRFFDGLIDDVRVYNYALSKAEIEKLAQGQ